MYDREWEKQMRPLRALPYGAPTSDIKTVCRGRLSNSNEAIFHWRLDDRKHNHLHLGWVFIKVPDTVARDRAILELANLQVNKRPVTVSAGFRRARPPRQHQPDSAAGPSTTTAAAAVVVSGTAHPPPLPPPPSAASAIVVPANSNTARSTGLYETEEGFEVVPKHSTAGDGDTWSDSDLNDE
ncbi:hypothetical protein LEL_01678 [Akanthomyces lecanii RCEF 1005]|uniref:Uncharacterized protein n=1 Tax=Akanthomyces lecanii RCEF 1005 TaxID=1081108 RepID=A0A168KTK1_CORDF|nr:hypothetical protein LEL_01678 [Akanthomyces lecanii RCEF 1005]